MSRDIQLGGRPSSSKQSKFKTKNVEFQAQKRQHENCKDQNKSAKLT